MHFVVGKRAKHLFGSLSLKKNDGSAGIPGEIRLLDADRLPQIMAIQKIIVDNLSNADMLESFSANFMERHIEKQGFILGVFADKELVAFRNVYFPDQDDQEWNLGIDIGLKKGELSKVANLQMVCVIPPYRGNALAKKMNEHAITMIEKSRKYDHLCATVSPYNYWNIRVLLNSGFVIRTLKDKYQGKLRYILHRNLKKETSNTFYDDSETVGLTDFTRQKTLFEKGYCGIEISEKSGLFTQKREELSNKFYLIFAKVKEKA